MSDTLTLATEIREKTGTSHMRRMRRLDAMIPAVLYGGGEAPVLLKIEDRHIRKSIQDDAFYASILTLKINGKNIKAVLKAIQRDPARSSRIRHLDFLRVSSKETLTMRVPLHFTNDTQAPGVKEGGILTHIQSEIEIKCLPKDLPEHIEVDLSTLMLDTTLHISDISLPSGVALATPVTQGEENDLPIIGVQTPRAVVEVEAAPEEETPTEADDDNGSDKK